MTISRCNKWFCSSFLGFKAAQGCAACDKVFLSLKPQLHLLHPWLGTAQSLVIGKLFNS